MSENKECVASPNSTAGSQGSEEEQLSDLLLNEGSPDVAEEIMRWFLAKGIKEGSPCDLQAEFNRLQHKKVLECAGRSVVDCIARSVK